MRDIVVIGSGHNALVAACYLARTGLDVEVVEADTVIGGAVSTVERWPGFQVDRGSSMHVMVRHTGIVEDLGLERYGLTYLDADPWAFQPSPGAPGGGIRFATSLDETCESVAAVCGEAEAAAYHGFVTTWQPRVRRLLDILMQPPTARRLGQGLWGLGRGSGLAGGELARQLMSSGDALLDATFRDERLRTALAWLGAQSGPPLHEPATAPLLTWALLLHDRPPGRPVGGSGGLTKALAARFTADGGTLRTGDGVAQITHDANGVTGVRTVSGDHVPARAVLAGCHVLTTLRLAADALPPGVLERAERTVRVGPGLGIAVRLATRSLPAYPDAPADVLHGMQLLVPDRTALRAAYGALLTGTPPQHPAVLAMTPSAQDPSLAPAGRHVVTLWAQWHAFELADGQRWADHAEQASELCIAAVEALAPGFATGVEHVLVQTPDLLEAEMGLLGGNVMHVEPTLDSMFSLRPLPELAGYRAPVPGLYLCGASTHPGGGVFGASGRIAAEVICKDRTPGRTRSLLTSLWGSR